MFFKNRKSKKMKSSEINGRFFEVAVEEKCYTNESRLRFHLKALFEGVNFENKKMLDIGGGNGIYSFYAACMGAEEVVCLEPEAAGCSHGMIADFKRLQNRGLSDRVALEQKTFQQYASTDKRFDIVLLYNSINHLDEEACINLLKEETGKMIYLDLFSRFYRLINPGGILIISDCSRHNLFAHLGIRNPLCKSIEWHKHHSPKTWAKLLAEVGFDKPEISWTSFNFLGPWGRRLLGNKAAAYFLLSHFCLKMTRPSAGGI
jgi:2-polyprenyl-3-methyl-5-hydroxy-6-metoxy-1,4-benzoquinol methylase